MNKAQLIDKLARESRLTKVEAQKILNAVLNVIKQSLKKGEEVKISGFGRWHVTKRKARQSKNPQTGEMIKIASQSVPSFRPGSVLKSLVQS